MFTVSHAELENVINTAIASLPKVYQDRLENVAIIIEDWPSSAQRQQLSLRSNQTLFGLYEGVPLTKRQGAVKLLPDKITIFQGPLMQASNNLDELRTNVGRTVWHEIAHYYGLDHRQISELEAQEKPKET